MLLIIFQSLQSAGSPGWGGFAKSLGEYGSLAARAPFRFSVPCLVSWFPLKMRVYTEAMTILMGQIWKKMLNYDLFKGDREARFRINPAKGQASTNRHSAAVQRFLKDRSMHGML